MWSIRRVGCLTAVTLVGFFGLASPVAARAGGHAAVAGRPRNGPISFTGLDETIYEVSPAGTLLHRLKVCATDGDFRWSSDGRQVAFLRTQEEFLCHASSNNAYVVGANGAGLVALSPGDSGSPAWSPAGNEIALLHCESETGSLESCAVFEVQPDGAGLHRIGPWGTSSEFSDPVGEPVWSPDGSEIAFSYCETDTKTSKQCAIFEVEPNGTGLHRLTPWGVEGEPIWSPNGEKLAIQTHSSEEPLLYVVDADGSHLRRLSFLSTLGYNETKPVWSPDSTELAFVREERIGHDEWRPDIYVINANGTWLRRLTHGGIDNYHPTWSPNGKQIAFVSYRASHSRSHCAANYAIFTMAANGTSRRRVTFYALSGGAPVWSPDGKLIAFPADFDSGGEVQCEREEARAWVPSGPGEPLTLNERLYVVAASGGPPRRLTNFAPSQDLVWERASTAAQ